MFVDVLVVQSKSTGATAAITSAASHATLYAIPPPFEQPDAYTRFVSMHASFASVEMIAFVNPTSSTFCIWAGLQQRPTFHELPTPFGKMVMKPLLSPSVAHPDRLFCPEPEPPSG